MPCAKWMPLVVCGAVATSCATTDLGARLAAANERIAAGAVRRDVLWGTLEDGSASRAYDAAIQLVQGVTAPWYDAPELDPRFPIDQPPEFDDAWWVRPSTTATAVFDAVDRLAAAFELVRRGAHARDATHRSFTPVAAEGDAVIGAMIATEDLVGFGVLRAWGCYAAGDDEACARATLDLLQFGDDHLRSPGVVATVVGAARLAAATRLFLALAPHDVSPPARLRGLGSKALEILATGVDRLDRELPPLGDALRVAAARIVRMVPSGVEDPHVRSLVETLLDAAAAADRAAERPWRECSAALADIESSFDGLPVGQAGSAAVDRIAELEESRRWALVWIRALRLAVAEAMGEAITLADPFGPGSMQAEGRGDRFVYWSVGPDGVDDCADGERDITLFVRR